MRFSVSFCSILLLTLVPCSFAQSNPVVNIETSMGRFAIEVFADKAPLSAENFLAYVDEGFFDGTIFHRVMAGFMVQGGGFTPDMVKKTTKAPIQNEADNGLGNARGTVAMARTNDPHSATAQFFVNVVDNGYLNHTAKTERGWGYAVFGKVIEGMDIVDAIAAVDVERKGRMSHAPVQTVTIVKATRTTTQSTSEETQVQN